ncbi:protein lingerer-like [Dorcoceras hygrometricum]|uniref:Protein lingerer-like n=1 Tax=Dorcoceras hygrometricum TaxID=472368 RepID=A0A2Z7BT29_9LAMI|nr:protein lingerer-like [Dorcoceras hygrometricum]
MAHRNQYVFPATNPDYTYNEVQQLSTAFSQSQTNSQRQTHTPFTNVMQSYTTPLPSTLLASNVPSSRESDLQFSPLSVAQSLSAKFGSSVSSIRGSAMSMSEYAPQAISGTNVAIGPPFLNTLLYIHILRQPSLSLGSFVNMIDYPFLKLSDEPTFCTIWCNYNL